MQAPFFLRCSGMRYFIHRRKACNCRWYFCMLLASSTTSEAGKIASATIGLFHDRFRFSSFPNFYPSFSFFILLPSNSRRLTVFRRWPTVAIDCMSIVVNVFNTESYLRHTPIIMTLDVDRALESTSFCISSCRLISALHQPGRLPVLFLPSPVSIPFRLSRRALSLSLSPRLSLSFFVSSHRRLIIARGAEFHFALIECRAATLRRAKRRRFRR